MRISWSAGSGVNGGDDGTRRRQQRCDDCAFEAKREQEGSGEQAEEEEDEDEMNRRRTSTRLWSASRLFAGWRPGGAMGSHRRRPTIWPVCGQVGLAGSAGSACSTSACRKASVVTFR